MWRGHSESGICEESLSDFSENQGKFLHFEDQKATRRLIKKITPGIKTRKVIFDTKFRNFWFENFTIKNRNKLRNSKI